jgi:asparagine synthase (glutamine-hydrolysing)
MFLIAITKKKINNNFGLNKIKEIKNPLFISTIYVDDCLCKYKLDNDIFYITDSIINSKSSNQDIIFSKIEFNQKNFFIKIFQSSISGKPIYYHINKKGEFFCSSTISLLRKVGVTIEENKKFIPEFFIYRYVMPPNTLYKNIYKVINGSEISFNYNNQFWKLNSNVKFSFLSKNNNLVYKDSNEYFDKTHHLLNESVKKLIDYKENVSVLLSGGIDSSIMSKMSQNNLGLWDSYSTGFPFEEEKSNHERKYAISAGKAICMNHTYFESNTKDYLRGVIESISLAEQPIHHLQSVCLHLLFKKGIPKDKNIIIQGVGAGGSFGNFRNFLYMKNRILFKILAKKPFKTFLNIISNITGRGKGFLSSLDKFNLNYKLSDPRNPIWSGHAYGSKKWVCDYFKITENEIIEGQYKFLKQFENEKIYDLWSLYSLFGDEDITMSIWTKIAEGNNKILYSPFYDLTVLNFVFSIPWKIKLKWPENILRKKIAQKCGIPRFIISRSKLGFGVSKNDWALKNNVLEPLVEIASVVFDEKEIRKMQSTENEKAMTFWNMLNYAIWKRLFINNEPLEKLLKELDHSISRMNE